VTSGRAVPDHEQASDTEPSSSEPVAPHAVPSQAAPGRIRMLLELQRSAGNAAVARAIMAPAAPGVDVERERRPVEPADAGTSLTEPDGAGEHPPTEAGREPGTAQTSPIDPGAADGCEPPDTRFADQASAQPAADSGKAASDRRLPHRRRRRAGTQRTPDARALPAERRRSGSRCRVRSRPR
jgi:hypothetical protein